MVAAVAGRKGQLVPPRPAAVGAGQRASWRGSLRVWSGRPDARWVFSEWPPKAKQAVAASGGSNTHSVKASATASASQRTRRVTLLAGECWEGCVGGGFVLRAVAAAPLPRLSSWRPARWLALRRGTKDAKRGGAKAIAAAPLQLRPPQRRPCGQLLGRAPHEPPPPRQPLHRAPRQQPRRRVGRGGGLWEEIVEPHPLGKAGAAAVQTRSS